MLDRRGFDQWAGEYDESIAAYEKGYPYHLKARGKIIIADISFNTRQELENCKKEAKGNWDADEYYIVAEEFRRDLENVGLTMSDTQQSVPVYWK